MKVDKINLRVFVLVEFFLCFYILTITKLKIAITLMVKKQTS